MQAGEIAVKALLPQRGKCMGFAYTPEAMSKGSMCWWILPLAPGVPERLVVRNERAFLTWVYEGAAAHPAVFTPNVVDEVLRTFSGHDAVLGAMGVYRAAFTGIGQTEPLTLAKVAVPVVAIGGRTGVGARSATRSSRSPKTSRSRSCPTAGTSCRRSVRTP